MTSYTSTSAPAASKNRSNWSLPSPSVVIGHGSPMTTTLGLIRVRSTGPSLVATSRNGHGRRSSPQRKQAKEHAAALHGLVDALLAALVEGKPSV